MTLEQILFIIFSAIILGAALMAVTRRNVLHAALSLVLSLSGVAGLYVLLEAPFLAAVQLIIYVGGIATLIISAITLTQDTTNPLKNKNKNGNSAGHNRQWWTAALVSVALCGVLGWVILKHDWGAPPGPAPEHSIAIPGTTLMAPEGFILPWAVTAVLLLVALTSAATIVKEMVTLRKR